MRTRKFAFKINGPLMPTDAKIWQWILCWFSCFAQAVNVKYFVCFDLQHWQNNFRYCLIHTISKWNSQFQITVGNWAAETSWDLSFFAHLLESLTEVWEMLMLFGVQTFCGSFDCLLSLFHRHKFPQLCLHCALMSHPSC